MDWLSVAFTFFFSSSTLNTQTHRTQSFLFLYFFFFSFNPQYINSPNPNCSQAPFITSLFIYSPNLAPNWKKPSPCKPQNIIPIHHSRSSHLHHQHLQHHNKLHYKALKELKEGKQRREKTVRSEKKKKNLSLETQWKGMKKKCNQTQKPNVKRKEKEEKKKKRKREPIRCVFVQGTRARSVASMGEIGSKSSVAVGTFMPLSPNKIVDKQLTQFFERTHSVRRYLAESHSCWPFKSGRKGPTRNLVRNLLKVHRSLKSSDMIKRFTRSIIWVQGRHLELRRQGMTVDGSHERGVYSMN